MNARGAEAADAAVVTMLDSPDAAAATFALAFLGAAAAVGLAVWRKLDVRVNVLILALVMLGVVALAFNFALTVDAGGDLERARLAQALESEAGTAAQRVEALAQYLAADRAYTRDLLAVTQIGVGVVTALSLAMGALLRSGNDLSAPLRQALDTLGGVTAADFAATMRRIEGALAAVRDIVGAKEQERDPDP